MRTAKVALNLASQAGLWYTKLRNNVVPSGAVNTPGRIHLTGRSIMTTLPPHADNGNLNDIPLKRCIKCGEEKPSTTEFFPQMKGSKDGLRNDCIECHRVRQKAWHVENRDRLLVQVKAYNIANRDRKLAYMKVYHEENRERDNAHKKAWHAANRDRALANMRVYGVA